MPRGLSGFHARDRSISANINDEDAGPFQMLGLRFGRHYWLGCVRSKLLRAGRQRPRLNLNRRCRATQRGARYE
jgi:hypothetical protein